MDQPETPPPAPSATPGDAGKAQESAPPPGTDKAREREQYQNFEGFLRSALREEYKASWKENRARFVSLMIASGQFAQIAAEKVEQEATPKNLVAMAGAVLLVQLGLKFLARGPMGALIVGGIAAAAVAYVALNYGTIAPKVRRFRELIESTRPRYGEIQTGLKDGRFSPPERDLMVDGLLHQFLESVRAEA